MPMPEWRKCELAGDPVDVNIHPYARECRAHLGFGDHVIPGRCAVCSVPSLAEKAALWDACGEKLVEAVRATMRIRARDEAPETYDEILTAQKWGDAALAAVDAERGGE